MSFLVASSIAALEEGRLVHAETIRSGCESNPTLQNCLVSMYAKCGSIENAQRIFYCMPKQNVVSLSAMLGGAMQGMDLARKLFDCSSRYLVKVCTWIRLLSYVFSQNATTLAYWTKANTLSNRCMHFVVFLL
ncbi:hypothetical protein O6H91_21G051100 [Diphasiastrum complanatum]|uniref:Uncharacterized protein n=1 Tax=Diphasiastrum complanatum TaxID=34168 RepID=A0ACC2AKD3_DIPCM|nr:hypothetical protein O6H91_21G051100 [Diphasiastrum complanatum]